MQNSNENISTEDIRTQVFALAKRLAQAEEANEATSKAFLWGATAVAYMVGAYGNTEFSEALEQSCKAYDLLRQKAGKARA